MQQCDTMDHEMFLYQKELHTFSNLFLHILKDTFQCFRKEAIETTVQLNEMVSSGLNFLYERKDFWEESKTY